MLRNGIIAAAAILFIVGVWYYIGAENKRQATLNTFAQCLSDAGAKFYGAFWCVHCQSEKALFKTAFASAEKYLPYIECSTPDTKGQLQVCKDEKISSYPTWKFADASVQTGEMSLKQLAAKTGCAAPN